ncbi:LacI family DNA-binding transcriptional regulator [candidate division KSB1 bacterium]|nr:LacI family DNA-binding transcriptional regulator [candidate division KSB1 bacterium]
MTATLKDIATKVGVHPSTVSRVLSGKYENFNVSQETRELIMNTAKEINYVPNETARSLRLRKTQIIGLIIPDILNPLFAGVARSIGNICEKNDYNFIVCNTDEVQDKEIRYIEMLKSRGTDGLIIVPVQREKAHIEKLKEERYPFVLAIRHFGDIETDTVVTDNDGDVYKAVEYLIKLGHRRIAFVGGHSESYAIRAREKGYKQALLDYNIRLDHDLVVGNGYTVESGYAAAKKIMNLPERPTAFMISSNIIIVGVLEAIFEAGLSIPEDISIIGFADSCATPYLSCPLTAISQPVGQIAKRAAELLFKRIDSPESEDYQKIVLPSKFIVGKTTLKAFGS